ncbi:hypothetical protein BH11PSE13_BH11PSE13_40500 [soil metagenome]
MQTMTPTPRPTTGAAEAAMLATHATLPLPPERLAAVAAILSAWLPDADALSHKMSAPALRDLMPITVLTPAHTADPSDAVQHGGHAP